MEFNNKHGCTIIKQHIDKPMVVNNLLEINKRFLGGGMSQNYAAIYFFEHYIQAFDFEYIVEIGSQKGALSLYFANIAAATEKFYFETYEIDKKACWLNREAEGVGHWFEQIEKISPYFKSIEANIFDNHTICHIIDNIVQFKKVLIICDGGDKPKEFSVFAPLIKINDHIIVHDWNHEIYFNQISNICEQQKIIIHKPFDQYCTQLNTLLMPFIKVS